MLNEKLRELWEIEKELFWWDWVIWNWSADSKIDEEYNKEIAKTNSIREKIELVKFLIWEFDIYSWLKPDIKKLHFLEIYKTLDNKNIDIKILNINIDTLIYIDELYKAWKNKELIKVIKNLKPDQRLKEDLLLKFKWISDIYENEWITELWLNKEDLSWIPSLEITKINDNSIKKEIINLLKTFNTNNKIDFLEKYNEIMILSTIDDFSSVYNIYLYLENISQVCNVNSGKILKQKENEAIKILKYLEKNITDEKIKNAVSIALNSNNNIDIFNTRSIYLEEYKKNKPPEKLPSPKPSPEKTLDLQSKLESFKIANLTIDENWKLVSNSWEKNIL